VDGEKVRRPKPPAGEGPHKPAREEPVGVEDVGLSCQSKPLQEEGKEKGGELEGKKRMAEEVILDARPVGDALAPFWEPIPKTGDPHPFPFLLLKKAGAIRGKDPDAKSSGEVPREEGEPVSLIVPLPAGKGAREDA
jgi:hypothetical protein